MFNKRNNYNVSKSSKEIGVTPIILRNRMKKFGIILEPYAGRKKAIGKKRDEIAKIIKSEFDKGLLVSNICKKYGWSNPFVLTICKEYSLVFKS